MLLLMQLLKIDHIVHVCSVVKRFLLQNCLYQLNQLFPYIKWDWMSVCLSRCLNVCQIAVIWLAKVYAIQYLAEASIKTVREYDNAIANETLEKYKVNGYIYIPTNLSACVFAHFSCDDIDILECTLDEKNAIHRTQMVAWQRKTNDDCGSV